MRSPRFVRRAMTTLFGMVLAGACDSPTEPQTHHVFVRGQVVVEAGGDARAQVEIVIRVPTCADAPYTGAHYLSSDERGQFSGLIRVPSMVSSFDACIVATLTDMPAVVPDTTQARIVRRTEPPDTADFVLAS